MDLVRTGEALLDRAYYPAGPAQEIVATAHKELTHAGLGPTCFFDGPQVRVAAEIGSVSVDSLTGGFTAPFRLTFPD